MENRFVFFKFIGELMELIIKRLPVSFKLTGVLGAGLSFIVIFRVFTVFTRELIKGKLNNYIYSPENNIIKRVFYNNFITGTIFFI